MSATRYEPKQAFPPYAYLPGINVHPSHLGGYREGIAEPSVESLSTERPLENSSYRFALDLFNHEYFWESHVYFEALWNAHSRKGSLGDFFKSMIKLSAAGVKMKSGRTETSILHLKRAHELLTLLAKKESDQFLGISLKSLLAHVDEAILSPTKLFQIY